jgi:hypothetical protein
MKIHPVEAELFHADGQTDMTKLIVAFRTFEKAPKINPGNISRAQHFVLSSLCYSPQVSGKSLSRKTFYTTHTTDYVSFVV